MKIIIIVILQCCIEIGCVRYLVVCTIVLQYDCIEIDTRLVRLRQIRYAVQYSTVLHIHSHTIQVLIVCIAPLVCPIAPRTPPSFT